MSGTGYCELQFCPYCGVGIRHQVSLLLDILEGPGAAEGPGRARGTHAETVHVPGGIQAHAVNHATMLNNGNGSNANQALAVNNGNEEGDEVIVLDD
jgi:hypothetical protein